MTWYDIGEPLLIHTEPNQPPQNRQYGVCTVLVPAPGRALTINGNQARGTPWKRDREGRPFSHLRAGVLGELDGGALGVRRAMRGSSTRDRATA